ncbi:hypothetical protein OU792_05335 [Algoriphagus sp. NF]|jgi:transcription elongation factor Elf1|uniref:hypothetical protein n=1 Tax=Algoriphagus sp. NF TaxID=2992756 RepID=UPI001065C59E|nr:hypothetical protein [Algoriphagus sp. NF]MDE0559401.1 hypothetical protein [Algoriphagus sp. NF]
MKLHRNCPICGSENLKGYAIDTFRKGPHISRVKCQSCELVFANPMADAEELKNYYTNYYDKELYEAVGYKNIIVNHFNRISSLGEKEIKAEAKFKLHLVPIKHLLHPEEEILD